MVKKISVKQKQSVKQNVNVRVHIHDKKKKRNYRKKRSASTGVNETHSSSYIPFTPIYIQSGNAPHLEVPTIRTPALVEPVPAVNRLGAEPLQNNEIPRGVVNEILPVENIVKRTRRTKPEMTEARAMGLEDVFSQENPMLKSPKLTTRIRNLAKENPTPISTPKSRKHLSESDSENDYEYASVRPIKPSINGGGVSSGGGIATKRTYKQRRSKEEIEAEKREKEARRLDRELRNKK